VGQDQILSSFTGASRQGLGQRDLGEILVPCRSAEQQRIAAYLDASCTAIDGRWPQAPPDRNARRPPQVGRAPSIVGRASAGLPLKDSGIESIGVIPAHWDVKQLRYACEVNYGIM